MILADHEIEALCVSHKMVEPFESELVREVGGLRVISYGLSSFGYDIRAGNEWCVFQRELAPIAQEDFFPAPRPSPIDPKAGVPDKNYRKVVVGDYEVVEIPAHGYALTHSVETFKMPENVLGVALGKSTYARAGVACNITPLEPGWEGQLTIEIANHSPFPVYLYAGEGICQILFFRGRSPAITYANRSGKYQGQRGVVLGRV